MKILIDLDEVLYPFLGTLRHWLLGNGHHHEMPDPTSWHFAEEWGLSEDRLWREVDAATEAGVLYRRGIPYLWSVEAVQGLWKRGHEIHLATARIMVPAGYQHTVAWLREWDVPHHSLTYTRDKSILRADVAVDDSPGHLARLRGAGIPVFVMDHPHNRSLGPEWPRVRDLREFAEEIEKMGEPVHV